MVSGRATAASGTRGSSGRGAVGSDGSASGSVVGVSTASPWASVGFGPVGAAFSGPWMVPSRCSAYSPKPSSSMARTAKGIWKIFSR